MITGFSCKENVHCEAFANEDISNFPYNEADTLVFENENGEQIVFTISNIEFSQAYDYDCNDLHGICNCERWAKAYASESSTSSTITLLKLLINTGNDAYIYYYNFLGFSFEFDFENDAEHINILPNYNYIGEFTTYESVYYNVYRASNENFSENYIDSVYFNRTSGILAFIKQGIQYKMK
jgi:hypothetical protein